VKVDCRVKERKKRAAACCRGITGEENIERLGLEYAFSRCVGGRVWCLSQSDLVEGWISQQHLPISSSRSGTTLGGMQGDRDEVSWRGTLFLGKKWPRLRRLLKIGKVE
jgi:hypothetical protein